MKFDTEHNLLTVLLIGMLAVLGAVFVLSFLVLGRADAGRIAADAANAELLARTLAQRPELAEVGAFREIIERPVFFADRRLPVVELADAASGEELPAEPEPEPAVEVPDLKSQVAGIIITPDLKLAMVTDNDSKETLLLSEGMTMAGDKSAWTVVEIQPRRVRLEAGSRRAELALEVETQALKPGAQPKPRQVAQQAPAADDGAALEDGDAEVEEDAEAAARARAEEIRRRVAERRAQLRAEAEARARQRNDG
ncbi:MAG: hypothetical protein RQ729_11665 [Wenzhouxiangellaceae bacterium]|nr:hypothetical protein [Wenzhouxiangellaceae bacterium]